MDWKYGEIALSTCERHSVARMHYVSPLTCWGPRFLIRCIFLFVGIGSCVSLALVPQDVGPQGNTANLLMLEGLYTSQAALIGPSASSASLGPQAPQPIIKAMAGGVLSDSGDESPAGVAHVSGSSVGAVVPCTLPPGIEQVSSLSAISQRPSTPTEAALPVPIQVAPASTPPTQDVASRGRPASDTLQQSLQEWVGAVAGRPPSHTRSPGGSVPSIGGKRPSFGGPESRTHAAGEVDVVAILVGDHQGCKVDFVLASFVIILSVVGSVSYVAFQNSLH